MFVVEVVKHVLPLVHAITPVLVESSQLFGSVEIHELHSAEHGVAYEHGKATTILNHGVPRAGSRQIRGGFGGFGIGPGILPLVNQTRIDGTYHHTQP